jgi:hypothetical protein
MQSLLWHSRRSFWGSGDFLCDLCHGGHSLTASLSYSCRTEFFYGSCKFLRLKVTVTKWIRSNWLSPYSRVLEKSTGSKLVKRFLAYYVAQSFITAFTKPITVSVLGQMNLFCVLTSSFFKSHFNPLAPIDPCMGRTAQLTPRGFILNTYSTNIRTEYFKLAA